MNGRVVAILPEASFLGDFTQVNGDFAGVPAQYSLHPGSRRVSGDNGGRYALKITTVNGDIKIDNGRRRRPHHPFPRHSPAKPPRT